MAFDSQNSGRDDVGINDAALQAQIDKLNSLISTTSTSGIIGAPEPCTPDFVIGYQKRKRRLKGQFCVNCEPGTSRIKVAICPTNKRTDETEFQLNILQDTYQLDESQSNSGHVEFMFVPTLEYSTQYDLVRLVSIGADGERNSLPSVDPVFNTTPIVQFTTPDQLGAPSGPDANLIIYNERDFLTADQHDAHVGLKVYAPLSLAGAAQTYEQAGVDWVRTVLTRDYPDGTFQEDAGPHLLEGVELTQTDPTSTPANRGYVVIEQKGLVAGGTYTWTKNIVHTIDGKVSTSGSVVFIAGNEQSNLANLTNTAVVIASTDPFDGKHVQPRLEFTQPAQPVSLKNYTLKAKKSADVDWSVVVRRDNSIQSDLYHKTLNDGLITGSTVSTTITGSGTKFTRLEAGWKIKVGAQTLTIANTPTSDTSLTVTTNPSSNFTGQPYTIVCVVPLVSSMKVKPSTSYNIEVLLRARSSTDVPLSLTTSFSTDTDGNVVADTAAPTTGGAITFIKVKKNGTHIRFPLPSVNGNTHTHNLLVVANASAPANGVKVVTAADLTTTTTLSSTDDTAGRIDAGRKKTTLELDKSQLLALFTPATTIYFWYYAVNSIGTSTRATTLSYDLTTGEASAVGDDAAAPSGLTAPTVKKLKKAGLKIDLTPPTAGNLKLRRANVYISNTAHTLWLSAADLTASTGTESVGAIQTPPSGGIVIPVSKEILESIFGAGATIHCYATWTNDVGTSSFSGNGTYSLGSGEAGNQDLAVPSGLSTPSIDWTAAGRLRIRGMAVSTNINTLKKKYLVISDGTSGAGTKYLDIVNRTTITGVSNEASARFEFGLKSHLTLTDIKRKIFTNVFGTGTFVAYWYAENDIGISSASSNSGTIDTDVMTEVMADDRDAIRVVDVNTLMGAPENLVLNGDLGFSGATSTDAKNWRSWDKSSTITNANCPLISTTGTDLHWDQTNHRIIWDGTGHAIVQKVRTLLPGDYYSLSFMIYSSGVFTSPFPEITIGLYRQASTTNDIESGSVILIGAPGSAYHMVGAVFRLGTGADTTLPHWISLMITASTLSTSKYLILDRFMLVRGKQPYAFVNADGDVGQSGTSDFDVSNPAAITAADIGQATLAAQGGYFDSGAGGEFSL